MSNKLAKHQEQKQILTGKQKKVLFWGSFALLCVAFILVWVHIFLTSAAFDKQMDDMIEGQDYYVESVVITDKRAEDAVADNAISQNYFFYYHNGKVNEYDKRMQVPERVYAEYEVGDSITSYTTYHLRYSYKKEGILPERSYRNNELMKVLGVLLGCGICFLALFGLLSRKIISGGRF